MPDTSKPSTTTCIFIRKENSQAVLIPNTGCMKVYFHKELGLVSCGHCGKPFHNQTSSAKEPLPDQLYRHIVYVKKHVAVPGVDWAKFIKNVREFIAKNTPPKESTPVQEYCKLIEEGGPVPALEGCSYSQGWQCRKCGDDQGASKRAYCATGHWKDGMRLHLKLDHQVDADETNKDLYAKQVAVQELFRKVVAVDLTGQLVESKAPQTVVDLTTTVPPHQKEESAGEEYVAEVAANTSSPRTTTEVGKAPRRGATIVTPVSSPVTIPPETPAKRPRDENEEEQTTRSRRSRVVTPLKKRKVNLEEDASPVSPPPAIHSPDTAQKEALLGLLKMQLESRRNRIQQLATEQELAAAMTARPQQSLLNLLTTPPHILATAPLQQHTVANLPSASTLLGEVRRRQLIDFVRAKQAAAANERNHVAALGQILSLQRAFYENQMKIQQQEFERAILMAAATKGI